MGNVFFINPAASSLDINDAINRKLEEAQSIAICVSNPDLYEYVGALWAISDLLEEIKQLHDVFCIKIKSI